MIAAMSINKDVSHIFYSMGGDNVTLSMGISVNGNRRCNKSAGSPFSG